MGRKKLIGRMAIPAAIICIASLLVLLGQIPYLISKVAEREGILKDHVSSLTQQYQKYLTDTAAKITSVPVDGKIIGETQSKILREKPQINLYLWMVDSNGEFIFGNPSTTFAKINTEYDKYKDNIENDGNFINRNDFLMNLIAHYNKIDFSEFASKTPFQNQDYKWRSYKEGAKKRVNTFYPPFGSTSPTIDADNRFLYVQSYLYLLSASVTNDTGEIIGELFLKIDDSKNHELYYTESRAVNRNLLEIFNGVFGGIAGVSGLFLWFLLPTWVYTDARKRDVKSPGLWAFLSMISLFFGLAIYLITRPSTYRSFHCPQCEKELNGTKAFCPHCGFDLAGTFCSQCQYPVKQSWQFCPSCRAEIGERKNHNEAETNEKTEKNG